MKHALISFAALFLVICPVNATEQEVKEALDLANQGKKTEAIQKLQTLTVQDPSDARIHLSLGLLYQTTDQDDKAIEQLEQADRLKPTAEGAYALGHLYEAKLLSTNDSSYMEKAKAAWVAFLNLAPQSEDRQCRVARKHLHRLEGHED